MLSFVLLSSGCFSIRSGDALEEEYCPEMTFEIDSLENQSGTIYFTRITYSNLSEKDIDIYLRARVSVIDGSQKQYGSPIWHAYLRDLNDLNSTVTLEPGQSVVDSVPIQDKIFQEMKGKEIILGRSGDREVPRQMMNQEVYRQERVCPTISSNSVFVN